MQKPIRVTTNTSANEQLIYFTSSSILKEDNRLIVISDVSGDINLHLLDEQTGTYTRLTDNHNGYMKSYVYFDGNEYKGFGKASVSIDRSNDVVYYIQDNILFSVNMRAHIKKLAELPSDQMTAFTHVSGDGSKICVPTTDARALEGFSRQTNCYDIDKRVREENLCSYIRVFDTQTGAQEICEKVRGAC